MPSSILHYLAYGSNLHPLRLRQRVPSARLLEVVELGGYALAFNKRGRDSSAKCNLVEAPGGGCVYGAIYRIDAAEKPALDRAEGRGAGYLDAPLVVTGQGRERACFTYFAQPEFLAGDLQPFHWYKALVLAGAGYLGFPPGYRDRIAAVASMDDPDAPRRREHEALLALILNYHQDQQGLGAMDSGR